MPDVNISFSLIYSLTILNSRFEKIHVLLRPCFLASGQPPCHGFTHRVKEEREEESGRGREEEGERKRAHKWWPLYQAKEAGI